MNAPDAPNEMNDFALVQKPPREVEKSQPGAKRILVGMVADTLVLARDTRGRSEIATHHAQPSSDDADAYYLKGCAYRQGKGVRKDRAESAKWLKKAAEKGQIKAQRELATHYLFYPRDSKQAVHWFRKAAEQNDAYAQHNLATLYRLGSGVKKNCVEAVKWDRKAAEQNYTLAQVNLGLCYAEGIGVEKNSVEAVRWYRKAAEQFGYSWAEYQLGLCYTKGQGVDMDYAEACKWFRLAAEHGSVVAKEQFAALSALMSLAERAESERLYEEYSKRKQA